MNPLDAWDAYCEAQDAKSDYEWRHSMGEMYSEAIRGANLMRHRAALNIDRSHTGYFFSGSAYNSEIIGGCPPFPNYIYLRGRLTAIVLPF